MPNILIRELLSKQNEGHVALLIKNDKIMVTPACDEVERNQMCPCAPRVVPVFPTFPSPIQAKKHKNDQFFFLLGNFLTKTSF